MHMQLPPQTTHGGFYFVLVSRNMSAFSKPSWPCAFIWQVSWSFPLASGFQNSHPTGSSKNFSLLNVFSLIVLVFVIGAPCWHFWEKLACCRVWCACWSLNTLDSCCAAQCCMKTSGRWSWQDSSLGFSTFWSGIPRTFLHRLEKRKVIRIFTRTIEIPRLESQLGWVFLRWDIL